MELLASSFVYAFIRNSMHIIDHRSSSSRVNELIVVIPMLTRLLQLVKQYHQAPKQCAGLLEQICMGILINRSRKEGIRLSAIAVAVASDVA